MKLATRVGSLLGKRQKSEDATFGDSLDLSQIALSDDTAHADDILGLLPNSEENTAPISKEKSVLDLHFMQTPLTELDMSVISEKESESTAEESPVTASQISSPPIAEVPVNSTRPSPQKLPSANLGATSPYEASNSAADLALAQSLRGNEKVGFCLFDSNGDLIELSRAYADIIGITDSDREKITNYNHLLEYMGKKADLGKADVSKLIQSELVKMQEHLSKGVTRTFDWTTSMRSGKNLAFSNKYTANNHLVSTVRDISEQTERKRLLHAGLQLGTAGYWSYSFITGKSVLGEYIIDMLSEAELARVEEQGIISIIHEDDKDRVQNALDTSVSAQTRMDSEFRVVLEGGKVFDMRMIGEVELSPTSRKPEVFIAFLNDLTDDKRRTRELAEAQNQSKNKSDFLARMSHEIKTPLNAIVGMTEALRDEVDNDEARETASFIADAAENLNTILSQTLEHERLATTDIVLDESEINLESLVRSTAAMWKKSCNDKGLTLDVRISKDLPEKINIDTSRLRQCLTNLISNAVKFTEKGRIIVAAAPVTSSGNVTQLLFAVKDSGIGMNEAAIENVFKPFRQGNETIQRRFGGSGLGMSITHRIVEAMNGHIKIMSKEGEGTTMALTLPLQQVGRDKPPVSSPTAKPKATHPAPIAAPKSDVISPPIETFHPVVNEAAPTPEVRKNVPIVPNDYSGFNVLVVEDNPINQAVVRKLLNKYIKSMDFAFHGDEALALLEKNGYDVILMDIHMPVKDGIETTLEIRNSGKPWADTVIVALTADPDYQQKRLCRNIGMNDALSKPVKRQELLDIMQKVLEDRRQEHSTQNIAQSA